MTIVLCIIHWIVFSGSSENICLQRPRNVPHEVKSRMMTQSNSFPTPIIPPNRVARVFRPTSSLETLTSTFWSIWTNNPYMFSLASKPVLSTLYLRIMFVSSDIFFILFLLCFPAGDWTGQFCLEIGLIVHNAVQQQVKLSCFILWKSEIIKTPNILLVSQPWWSAVHDIPGLKDVHFFKARVIISKVRIVFTFVKRILFYMEFFSQL